MALPTSREQLKEFCLRKLGHPAIQINVDQKQLEDRIDEAIQKYQTRHFDGSERIYVKHQVTASRMTFAQAVVGTFAIGEIVEGQTSKATAKVVDQAADNLSIRFITISGTFQNGEDVLGKSSGATATLAAANAVTLGDIDNGYIVLPNSVISVMRVISTGYTSASMFDVRYQFAMHFMHQLSSIDLVGYASMQTHLSLINDMLSQEKLLRFNKKKGLLYLDIDWSIDVNVDQFLVVECQAALDPQTYGEIYSDEWLIKYVTALFKEQWGNILKKYRGVRLPGGIELDGAAIYQEAVQEIEKLDEELKRKWQHPPMFTTG